MSNTEDVLSRRAVFTIVGPAALWVAFLSLQPHKEERFLSPVHPRLETRIPNPECRIQNCCPIFPTCAAPPIRVPRSALVAPPNGTTVQLAAQGGALPLSCTPQIPNPGETPNSESRNRKPRIPNPKSRFPNPESRSRVPNHDTAARNCHPKSETRNPKLETRNSKLETRNPKLKTRNSKSETRNHGCELRGPKSKIRKRARGRAASRLSTLTHNPECEIRIPNNKTQNLFLGMYLFLSFGKLTPPQVRRLNFLINDSKN